MTGTRVPSEIAAQRAALQQQWAGQTICDALAGTAGRYGDMPAYSDKDGAGPWQTISWAQARARRAASPSGCSPCTWRSATRCALTSATTPPASSSLR